MTFFAGVYDYSKSIIFQPVFNWLAVIPSSIVPICLSVNYKTSMKQIYKKQNNLLLSQTYFPLYTIKHDIVSDKAYHLHM